MPGFNGEPKEREGIRELHKAAAVVVMSLGLLSLPPAYQESVAGFFRGSVLAPFLWVNQGLTSARNQALEVGELQARLDSLSSTLLNDGALRVENRQLRSLLGLSARKEVRFRPVNVLRPGAARDQSLLILDAGNEVGVMVGSPIVVAQGLVGVVRAVGDGRSVAMDWTHPDFRASAMTVDGREFGMVEPQAGRFREDTRLVLNGAPYYSDIDVGAQIVTSGLGGVYPRGVPIGTVEGVAEEEAGWRRSYFLRPAVFPAEVIHALVLVEGVDLGRTDQPADWWPEAAPPTNPFDSLTVPEIPRAGESPPAPGGDSAGPPGGDG